MRKALVVLTAVLLLIPVVATAQNSPPVADAGEDQMIFTGEYTMLWGSAVDPDGQPIAEYLWTVESSPEGSTPEIYYSDMPPPQFTADTHGDYLMSLIASDGIEWGDPDFMTVHVHEILPPEAVIDVDVTSGPAPLTVQFDASSSFVDPYAGTLTYDWNFDDGDSSAEATPLHTYESVGTYTAVLRVVDSLDQSDLDTIEIVVEEPPPAWGEASIVESQSASSSKGLNCLLGLLIPVGAVGFWKGLRKR